MRNARPTFNDTLFDWEAQPTNRRIGSLFQPKGLGAAFPMQRRRNAAQRALMLLAWAVTGGAGVVAVMALARVVLR